MTTWNGGDRREHKFARVGRFYRQSAKRSLLHRIFTADLHAAYTMVRS